MNFHPFHPVRLVISLCAAFCAFAAPAARAAEAQSSAFGQDNMDLEADSIQFVMSGGEIQSMQALGDVRMVSETMNIQCETLTLDPATNKLNAESDGQKKVKIKSADLDAECGNLVYDLNTQDALLKGGSSITQQGTLTQGENIKIVTNEDGSRSISVDSGSEAQKVGPMKIQGGVKPTANTGSPSDSRDKVKQMQNTFGGTEADAQKLVYGDSRPATAEIPTTSNEEAAPRRNRPPSGRITADNVDQIPDNTASRPLETSE